MNKMEFAQLVDHLCELSKMYECNITMTFADGTSLSAIALPELQPKAKEPPLNPFPRDKYVTLKRAAE